MNLDSLKKKLVLGTVQLGLPYGINNQNGRPDQTEAFRILNCASSANITILDSAEAYGDSLSVISAYMQSHPHSPFQVISKFIGKEDNLEHNLIRTLEALSVKTLYAYMFHRYSDYISPNYKAQMLSLKQKGLISRIGVSLYSLEELKVVSQDPAIDLIQLPFNPFDASGKKIELMEMARANGKEIHVRSVFLQGLFFKTSVDLTGNLKEFAPAIDAFHDVLQATGLNVRQACLNFALYQPAIDRVLIGVETSKQLQQNLEDVLPAFNSLPQLNSIPSVPEELLNPSTWKP